MSRGNQTVSPVAWIAPAFLGELAESALTLVAALYVALGASGAAELLRKTAPTPAALGAVRLEVERRVAAAIDLEASLARARASTLARRGHLMLALYEHLVEGNARRVLDATLAFDACGCIECSVALLSGVVTFAQWRAGERCDACAECAPSIVGDEVVRVIVGGPGDVGHGDVAAWLAWPMDEGGTVLARPPATHSTPVEVLATGANPEAVA